MAALDELAGRALQRLQAAGTFAQLLLEHLGRGGGTWRI